MLKVTVILLALLCFACSNGKRTGTEKTVSETRKPDTSGSHPSDTLLPKDSDTLFISRTLTTEFYHAIFIDTTCASKQYRWLVDFTFDENDRLAYQGNYDYYAAKYPGSFKKQKLLGLAKEWLPIYPYKGKYYLYAPSDWGNAGRRILNDSAYVYWNMDGPMPVPLKSVKKITSNKYTVNLGSYDGESQTINLYIVDPRTQLTLFEFPNEPEANRYELFVPNKNAHLFPLIINYCKEQKQFEFSFDQPDVKKLLKR